MNSNAAPATASPAAPSASAIDSAVSSSSDSRCAICPLSPRNGRRIRFRLCVSIAKWLSNSGRAFGSTAAAAVPSSPATPSSWTPSAAIWRRRFSKSGRRDDFGSFSR